MPGQGPTRIYSLTEATADETLGHWLDCTQLPYVAAYVIGIGTLDSGVITLEEADWDPKNGPVYDGVWSAITTVNANDVTGGAQKAIHFAVAKYRFVRARVSTVIAGSGGSVTVVLMGTGPS